MFTISTVALMLLAGAEFMQAEPCTASNHVIAEPCTASNHVIAQPCTASDPVIGQEQSSLNDTLSTSAVFAERAVTVSRDDTVTVDRAKSATEHMLLYPGIVVGEYGGPIGPSSVNLRGLGSPHTVVMVDGIKVSNLQSGQPDLGTLWMDSFDGIIVDYAQNSVNFTTQRPVFGDRKQTGDFRMKAGSFGSLLPYARMNFKCSDDLAVSVNAAAVKSEGDYPYGDGQVRQNNDVTQLKAGVDLFGITGGGDWMAKVYFNDSDRGTPGSSTYPSTDRQLDRNIFIQGQLRQSITPAYSIDLSAKAAADRLYYKSTWGDSEYNQKELQVNASQRLVLSRNLMLSAVTSLQQDWLESAIYDASRLDATVICGAALKTKVLHADLTLQYEGIFDKGATGMNNLSPAIDIRIVASKYLDIIGFARRAYRAPTFNELYYPGYGNPELKPEDALLTDLGLEYHRPMGGHWTLSSKIDAFYNHLLDKITSAPTVADPSIWLPYNIGEVKCVGADADASVSYANDGLTFRGSARYSFQYAESVPYLSRHSVVLSTDAGYRAWEANAVWNLRAGREDSYGPMPNWNTLDIAIGKAFAMKGGSELALKVNCRNIFDCRYEMISYYPMQGRSILAGLFYTL